MTTDHIVSTVIWWTAVAIFVTRWLVREWEWYGDSRRVRHEKLLQDIADLERELGLNVDDPAYRSVWRQQPRIYQPPGLTWSGPRSGIGRDQ